MANMILIAIGEEGGFQVVGEADSLEECRGLANEYEVLGPEDDCLAPEEFQVHARSTGGFYRCIATLAI